MSEAATKLKIAGRRLSGGDRMSRRLLLSAVAVYVAWPSGPARAATPWIDRGEVAVRLLVAPPAGAEAGPGAGVRRVGIEFRMVPGWTTYWREPGDAGMAPRFDWAGSVNLKDAVVSWPAPVRLSEGGMATFGYEGRVVLPVRLVPRDPDTPVGVKLNLDFAVCGTICVPKRATLTLPPGAAGSAADAAILDRFAQTVPQRRIAGLGVGRVDLSPQRLELTLHAAPPLAPQARLDLIAEGPDGALILRPEIRRASDGGAAVFTLRPRPGAVLPETLTLTLVADGRALSVVAARPRGQ
jgi:suppressor for copper-sensitivity B